MGSVVYWNHLKHDSGRQQDPEKVSDGHALCKGRPVRLIADHFIVTTMTAKRDIAELKNHAVIEFSGAPKTGRYRRK